MNRQGKRSIYLNDFTAGLTQYVHLKAKKWNTSHPRNNLLWIIDKEMHLQQEVSNSKIFAWGSMFQVQVLHGTKASAWTLNAKRRKNLPYFWLVYVLGKTWVLTPFFPWSVWWLFLNVGSFAKPMFFLSLGKGLGKGDQCSLSSASRTTKILYIALNT